MTTTSYAIHAPPFWPSRRLWLKMLLAVICGSALGGGGVLFSVWAAAGLGLLGGYPSDPLSDWWALVAVLMPFAGSILMGWALSPNWRGIGAGGAVLVALLVFVLVYYGVVGQ